MICDSIWTVLQALLQTSWNSEMATTFNSWVRNCGKKMEICEILNYRMYALAEKNTQDARTMKALTLVGLVFVAFSSCPYLLKSRC